MLFSTTGNRAPSPPMAKCGRDYRHQLTKGGFNTAGKSGSLMIDGPDADDSKLLKAKLCFARHRTALSIDTSFQNALHVINQYRDASIPLLGVLGVDWLP